MGQDGTRQGFCDFQRSRSLCFLACCQVEGEIFVPFSVLPFSQGDDLRHLTTYRLKSARDHKAIFIQYSYSIHDLFGRSQRATDKISSWINMDSAYGLSEPGMYGNLCIVTLPCLKESFPNCENCAGVSNEAVLGIRFRHGATACHSLPQLARWHSLPADR